MDRVSRFLNTPLAELQKKYPCHSEFHQSHLTKIKKQCGKDFNVDFKNWDENNEDGDLFLNCVLNNVGTSKVLMSCEAVRRELL